MEAIKNKEEKKQLGSFYSPAALAQYVASKMCDILPSKRGLSILDPAVGDGELLIAVNNIRNNPKDFFIGVDIDESALESTFNRFKENRISSHSFYCDALNPKVSGVHQDGWLSIKHKCNVDKIDCIISNPPWGAEIFLDNKELSKYKTAIGQYDIYDLFIEKSIDLLSDGGVYAFIVPDSIYRKEHKPIRKLLLETTSIKYIIRIGEFFFEDVNTSVSVIIGVKGLTVTNDINCVHIPNSISKDIIANKLTFEEIESNLIHQCKQESFIIDDYSFTIDLTSNDVEIIKHLDSLLKISPFLKSTRGVELSKKGYVVQCPLCQKWQPYPAKKEYYTCIHCGNYINIDDAKKDIIINKKKSDDSIPLLRGEDMKRYNYKQCVFIKLGKEGINYKPLSLYDSPKILIRKTGVGITAVLDYNHQMVNQVVYILKPTNFNPSKLSLEFYIALLNSRLITYYIIKKYGSSNWCTHPYISQDMVGKLPIPNFNSFNDEDWNQVREIETIIKKIYSGTDKELTSEDDLRIECILLRLFNLNTTNFKHIMETISNVEQLIPFKRLLNIPKEKWDIGI